MPSQNKTDKVHGKLTSGGGIAAEALTQYVARIERLNEEKQALSNDIKDVFAEAKSIGFDVKILRNVIKRRKLTKSDLEEFDSLIDIYERAIANTPIEEAIANTPIEKAISEFKDKYDTEITQDDTNGTVFKIRDKKKSDDIQNQPTDELYDQAVQLVLTEQVASCSFIQRKLHIGYNKAAQLIDLMEAKKIISPAGFAGRRTVYMGLSDENNDDVQH